MFKQISKIGLLALALGTTTLSFADDALEDTMEEMKKNFKKLSKIDDTAEMKSYVENLVVLTDKAAEIKPTGEDDAPLSAEALEAYDKNMQKLKDQLASLQDAIVANDQAQAKSIIGAINDNRKESHDYFDVD